jgi:hypothetical protein
MLLNKIKKNSMFYISTLIVIFFCITQSAIADDGLNQIEKNIKRTLRSLGIPQSEESKNNEQNLKIALQAFNETLGSDDKETTEILKQWDDYVKSASHFSNSNYADAINQQITDYYNAITDINYAIGNTNARRKREYSSSWVDDLFDRFGKKVIKKNDMAVRQSLLALSAAGDDEDFERKLKNLIYIETMLFGSYKRYYGLFLDFYREQLDQNAQKKLEPRKNLAESFLALIDKISLTSMHDTTVLQKILSENEARKLNDDVFTFLKNHRLSNSLYFTKALEDFNRALEN